MSADKNGKTARGARKIKLCFVCTGNTCRSPMAEILLKSRLKAAGSDNARVVSRGISAQIGAAISPYALGALKSLGLKNVRHRAKGLELADYKRYDLFICMTENHKRVLSGGKKSDKIVTLAQLTGGADVDDPWGGREADYLRTAERLNYACAVIADGIKNGSILKKEFLKK